MGWCVAAIGMCETLRVSALLGHRQSLTGALSPESLGFVASSSYAMGCRKAIAEQATQQVGQVLEVNTCPDKAHVSTGSGT